MNCIVYVSQQTEINLRCIVGRVQALPKFLISPSRCTDIYYNPRSQPGRVLREFFIRLRWAYVHTSTTLSACHN